MSLLRIAHLSDLHFAHGTYSLTQFFSKRWVGNLKYILYRNKTFQTDPLWQIPSLLKDCDLDAIVITGDMATTSLEKEFEKAKAFIDELEKIKISVFFLPGNHDVYTKDSERKKLFYNYFNKSSSHSFNLKNDRIDVYPLIKGWWWIALDSAVASNIFFSHGVFSEEMEKKLKHVLQDIPTEDKVIIGNHFPLFGTGNFRHDLMGKEKLQKIVRKFPQVKLYLHGHDHVSYTIDRREEGYPLVHNPGSCTDAKEKSFSILEMPKEAPIFIEKVKWLGNSWERQKEKLFY